ncbi:MAG: TRAP transporter substrate-binding protein [Desulfitobacterium hafniense]|nr:TRAP transporter substrate-binding protein [Desulfitobacterium hafniense]
MRVNRKIQLLIASLLAVMLVISGCGGSGQTAATSPSDAAKDKQIQIRLAYPTGNGSAQDIGSKYFKEKVEKMSNGRIQVALYADGQLGKDVAVMDSLKLGTIEMTNVSTPLQTKMKEVGAFDLPYLFKDRKAVAKVANGPIWEEIQKKLPSQGMVGLAMLENGYRHITNSKRPIIKPEDLKGLKLRIPEGDIRMLTFKTYGANPTPMNFNEVFSALQQGVVDGQENPLVTIESSRFNEVQKYLSLSNHVYTPSYLVASKIWWDKLSADDQKLLMQAAKESGDQIRAWGEEQDKKSVETLKSKGMTVNDVDFTAFVEASKPVYEKAKESIGAEFVDKLLKAVQ